MIFSLTSLILRTHIWSGALPALPELWPFVLPRGFQKLLYETSVSAVSCQVDKRESPLVLDHNQTIWTDSNRFKQMLRAFVFRGDIGVGELNM